MKENQLYLHFKYWKQTHRFKVNNDFTFQTKEEKEKEIYVLERAIFNSTKGEGNYLGKW